MNWPEKVRIGWRDYRLVFSDLRGSERWGEHWSLTSELHVCVHATNDDPSRVAHTLLHEILYGIRESCMPQGFWAALAKAETEEREELVVSAFADGLAQVARDNPELWVQLAQALATPRKDA